MRRAIKDSGIHEFVFVGISYLSGFESQCIYNRKVRITTSDSLCSKFKIWVT